MKILHGVAYSGGTAGTTITSEFVYDGSDAVLAFDGTGAMTDRFLWGPAVDQILADERFSPTTSGQMPTAPGTMLWTATDNEGTVRDLVTFASGSYGMASQIVDHRIYDSFGAVAHDTNPSATFAWWGHNGVFTDYSTGLELHGERWYAPSIQRWLSPDPALLTYDTNPYRYAGNGPTDYTDPSGLDSMGSTNGAAWTPQQWHDYGEWESSMGFGGHYMECYGSLANPPGNGGGNQSDSDSSLEFISTTRGDPVADPTQNGPPPLTLTYPPEPHGSWNRETPWVVYTIPGGYTAYGPTIWTRKRG